MTGSVTEIRTPLTRAEGYARSRGKEQAGLDVVADFFADLIDVALTSVTGADDNYRHGDFRAPSGETIEVKRQPIDPHRYRQNFVEVFETTTNPRHSDGFARLAHLLSVPQDVLASVRYADHRTRPVGNDTLGHLPRVSVSVTSIHAAAYTVYVNPADIGVQHLYVYGRGELTSHIRAAMPRNLRRGAGMSNQDTFAVLIPLAQHRWTRMRGHDWSYSGDGDEETARATLAQRLASRSRLADAA